MRNILTIFKKEMRRIFSDKRMIAALFLPGILIFVVYTLMGNFVSSGNLISNPKNSEITVVYTDNYGNENPPKIITYFDIALKSTSDNNILKTNQISTNDFDKYFHQLEEKEITLLIRFTDDFENQIFQQKPTVIPNIEILYNGSSELSSYAYQLINSCINYSYTNFTINIGNNGQPINPNVSNEDSMANQIMGFIIPIVTISLLYSTIISIVPETIAGEKERGTLSSLLLTPIKRSDIVLGKIASLTIASIASGVVSFVGLLTSLPKLLGTNKLLSINFGSGALLFVLIISTLILFVTFGTMVSCFAKSTKEANSYLGPLTMFFLVLAILPGILNVSAIPFAFIPIVNVSECMSSIIRYGIPNPLYIGFTILSNFIFTGLIILITTKLFDNEKVIVN